MLERTTRRRLVLHAVTLCLIQLGPSALAQPRTQDPALVDFTGERPRQPELEPPARAIDPGMDVPPVAAPVTTEGDVGPQPFGHNLFQGNFLRTRQDGLNPDYIVMPGDRVAVQTWGAVSIADVFVVDGQGNIFLPEIGPIRLAGVPNAELTDVVEKSIRKVYLRHFGVYTNLLTAKPVAVFVTGGVLRPGSYAGVPSDSILFFLDQAGGIDPFVGSYRRVQILREGAPLAEVDLYDFMLEGTLDSPHQNSENIRIS